MRKFAFKLLIVALILSACHETTTVTPEETSVPTAAASPTPTMPTDLTPITIDGTSVIIPQAIEFTPTPDGPPPSATPVGFVPGDITAGDSPSREPRIIAFDVTPQQGLDFGSPVTVTWEVDAQTASVSYSYMAAGYAPSSGETLAVDSATGSHTFNLKPVDALPLYIEFSITAGSGSPDLPKAINVIQVPIRCPYPWFFAKPPHWCPSTEDTPRDAVLQPFEKAQMVGIASGASPAAAPGNQVTVLYSTPNFWEQFPDVAPMSPDIILTPAPDPMFFGLWQRGAGPVDPLKAAVGQPTGPALRYQAHTQCEFAPSVLSISQCFFTLPDHRVILLYVNGHFGRNGITWQEWKGP